MAAVNTESRKRFAFIPKPAVKAKGKGKVKAAKSKASGNGSAPGIGVIRKMIVAEMTRRNWTRRDVVNATKLPTTPVFEFLREGETDRGICLRHAERIIHVMGIGITKPDLDKYPVKKETAQSN